MDEVYRWRAIVGDWGQYPEVDHVGQEHGFAQLPDGVTALALEPQVAGLMPLSVEIPPDCTPVFFRRRVQEVKTSVDEDRTMTTEPDGEVKHLFTCIGYQRLDGTKHLLYCLADGSILVTDRTL